MSALEGKRSTGALNPAMDSYMADAAMCVPTTTSGQFRDQLIRCCQIPSIEVSRGEGKLLAVTSRKVLLKHCGGD